MQAGASLKSSAVESTCACCDSQQVSVVLTMESDFEGGGPRTLVECGGCGLVFLHPRPSPEDLTALLPAYQERTGWILEDLRATWFGRFGVRMVRNGRVPKMKPGDVLDIGSPTGGGYLRFMQARGWRVDGIKSISDAEEALASYASESFDLVTLWQVIEHAENPARLLAQVARVLRPRGRVILEVPNFASVWARLFGRFWFPLELPFHLYQFTPGTLTRMMNDAGLNVVDLTGEPAPAQVTWCLDVLWCYLRRKPWKGRLLWSPIAVIALYPLEFVLAKMGLSNHFRVTCCKQND